MAQKIPSQAVVLLGHGSRRTSDARPFSSFCRWFEQASPGTRVMDAYLSLCPPTLEQAVDVLVAEGLSQIDVVPMFLVEGHHVQEDLPATMQALHERHPHLSLRLTPGLGADNAILPLLKTRLQQAKAWEPKTLPVAAE